MAPLASPRNDIRRRTRRQPLTRSTSLFGTIRNFISAPLSWLSIQDFEDAPGKRRRNLQLAERDDREHEEGEAKAKRKRLRSPTPEAEPVQQYVQQSKQPLRPTQATTGYLDVPEQLISPPAARDRTQHAPSHGRSASVVLQRRQQRQSLSPLGNTQMARTMSMDPPVSYKPRAVTRNMSIDSYPPESAHDLSMSPTRASFYVRPRMSLTPQPSGQVFGPAPHGRDRDASEPPPLTALMSNPVFVKPPPQSQSLTPQPTETLGSLVEARRARSPLGQHNSLLIGRKASADAGPSVYLRPVNAAEKALHDLDVYKTPLLPTRLRGSGSIPDAFKPKRLSTPAPMPRGKDDKPRLGMTEKKKSKANKEEGSGSKPYSGQGGMKKLLARRKQEEEEERQQHRDGEGRDEQSSKIVMDKDTSVSGTIAPASSSALPRPTVPDFSSIPTQGRESSLRVGRSKISRNHASSVARPKNNRFSAVFDEDDGDDSMSTSDDNVAAEAPKRPTLFQAPAGFSFEKNAPSINMDSKNAKELPITSLPFSFTKPSQAPTQDKSSVTSGGGLPKHAESESQLPRSGFARTGNDQTETLPTVEAGPFPTARATAPSTPVMQTIPSITLTHATPGLPVSVANPLPVEPATASIAATSVPTKEPTTIPDFFANSAIFSKPTVTIAPPPVSSLFAKPPVAEEKKVAPEVTPLFGAPNPRSAEPTAPHSNEKPVFGVQSAVSTAEAQSGIATNATPRPAPAIPSFFGSTPAPAKPVESSAPSASSFSFGTPAEKPAAAAAPAPPFSFGQPSKTADSLTSSTSLPFSFGTPSKPAESAQSTSNSLPFSLTGAADKLKEPNSPAPSQFSFGTSASSTGAPSEPPKAAEPSAMSASPFTFDAPKPVGTKLSLFGATNTPPSLSFGGAPTPAANTAAEAPKPMFTFGQSTATPAIQPPSVQAPKPSFGSVASSGFSFGQPASPAAEAPAPVKSPFTFGATPATPPATTADKPAFSFGAPASAAPSTAGSSMFGGPPSSGNAADVSKPFMFGAPTTPAAPARPATPPREDQEVNMDESPVRGETTTPAKEPLKVTTGFSFGVPSAGAASPFGQSSATSPFAFGASASAPSPFGAKPETKVDTKPASSFGGFGQSSSAGFSYGQKAPETTPQPSALSPSPFSANSTFGAPPAMAPSFSFGGTSSTGGFGQAAVPTSASTPTSPSTFAASTPFGFGAPPASSTAPSNPFAFGGGSQPASPAGSTSGLPSASGSSAPFAFGQPSSATTQSPASPFGGSVALPPPAAGGALFTMGAAPTANNTSMGPNGRLLKKLPTRRGGKR